MTTTTDAVSRYQQLLRTADPSRIEQAHEQAFAAMTSAERTQVLQALSTSTEVPADASASSLARSATRLEVERPGTLQRVLGDEASLGTTLLASLAAGFVGSVAWSSATGGDGMGGRPGLLARFFGLGRARTGALINPGGVTSNFLGGPGGYFDNPYAQRSMFGDGSRGRGGGMRGPGGGGPGGPPGGPGGGGSGGPGGGGPGGRF